MTMWRELVSVEQPSEVTYQYALKDKRIPFRIRASIIRRFRKGVQADGTIKRSTKKESLLLETPAKNKGERLSQEANSKKHKVKLPKRVRKHLLLGERKHGAKHNYRRIRDYAVRIFYSSRGKFRARRRGKGRLVSVLRTLHLKGPQGLWQ